MTKRIVIYALVLAAASIALQLLQYKLVFVNHSLELYGGVIAILFIIIGIAAGRKLAGKKEVIVEKQVTIEKEVPVYIAANTQPDFTTNEKWLEKLNISKREHEILELMATGLSNQEIADKLFVSINTVKTHTSNLFVKLDVKRRTQAVTKARELQLVA